MHPPKSWFDLRKRERERETQRDRERETERETDRERDTERERQTESPVPGPKKTSFKTAPVVGWGFVFIVCQSKNANMVGVFVALLSFGKT